MPRLAYERASRFDEEMETHLAPLAPLAATIRLARGDDAEFLVGLSEQVFERYVADAGRGMLRMMRGRASTVLVAEAGELRLGFAVINIRSLGRPFGPWDDPAVANLDAIAVRPTLAGCGLGRLLLVHAEQAARDSGAVSMSLRTAVTNKRAQRLFDRAGYQLVVPIDSAYKDDQRGFAMFKSLSADVL